MGDNTLFAVKFTGHVDCVSVEKPTTIYDATTGCTVSIKHAYTWNPQHITQGLRKRALMQRDTPHAESLAGHVSRPINRRKTRGAQLPKCRRWRRQTK